MNKNCLENSNSSTKQRRWVRRAGVPASPSPLWDLSSPFLNALLRRFDIRTLNLNDTSTVIGNARENISLTTIVYLLKVRAKHDITNTVVAGCATGGAISARGKNISVYCAVPVVFTMFLNII